MTPDIAAIRERARYYAAGFGGADCPEADRETLLALLDEAAAALRFYANGEHLTTNTWDGTTAAENGATARAVLSRLESRR